MFQARSHGRYRGYRVIVHSTLLELQRDAKLFRTEEKKQKKKKVPICMNSSRVTPFQSVHAPLISQLLGQKKSTTSILAGWQVSDLAQYLQPLADMAFNSGSMVFLTLVKKSLFARINVSKSSNTTRNADTHTKVHTF
jgi:hypothetical protein